MKTLLPSRNIRRGKLLVLAGLLVLGTGVGAAAPTGSAPSFAPAKSYPTGRSPHSVAIGDLNGDGKPDLVTANGESGVGTNTVSVLLNRGDGRFRAHHAYRTGRSPHSVAIGDLNGDGKPDLATANLAADTVTVLLNRGDGSFQAKRDFGAGHNPQSVVIGDLNGDGKPDLATSSDSQWAVAVLLNRGDGSFQANRDYGTGPSLSVAIDDLNGDGTLDLATARAEGNTLSVLFNRGDGSFQTERNYVTPPDPRSIALGDLNGDGKSDLVTENSEKEYGSTVLVLLNTGVGSFRRKVYRVRGSGQVAIGDLTGDGKPELVTATVSVFVNRGDGTFRPQLDYRAGPPFSVAIGDLNGDRKPDLATANGYANTISVLINRPGLCTVQDVKRQTLTAARRAIVRANCRVGKIRRAYSSATRGRVIAQKPGFGAVLRGGGKVNLVVSRGRRP